jgi:hypothetical protein
MASISFTHDAHAADGAAITLPTQDALPNASISFAHVAHASFPAAGASAEAVAAFLLSAVDESNEHAFSFGIGEVPILSPFGVALLGERTASLLGAGGAGVGSMHSYGTDILERFPLLAKELGERLAPLFAALYRPPGAPLPVLHMYSAHCIGYGVGPTRETALKLHVDASEYTATICVRTTPDLEGTQLVFHGQKAVRLPEVERAQGQLARALKRDLKNGEDERNHVQKLPRAGHALLHLGAHPHRTLPVARGERFSWVLWWHSSEQANGGGGE